MNKLLSLLTGVFLGGATLQGEYHPAQIQNIHQLNKLLDYEDAEVVEHLDEFFSDKVIVHHHSNCEGELIDFQDLKKRETERVLAIPGKKRTLMNMFVSDDIVVGYLKIEGVHVGDFMGIPATDKEFTIPIVLMYRFCDGKIIEVWSSWDRLALINQLKEDKS
jgi:predicted ester cyclase